jgi:hypothetical protein
VPEVQYQALLASGRGLFRASVEHQSIAYTLTVSLDYASAVTRASILRKMGFLVVNPKVYPKMKIRFSSFEDRKYFLEKMEERSLTTQERWVESLPEDEPTLLLRQVVLEPGRVRVNTVHWGMIRQEDQKDRRIFRALIIPFLLTEFPEKVNQYAWGVGRVFSEGVWLEYVYADAFPDATYADLKWAVRKVAQISRSDLVASVSDSLLPADITQLLGERLVSRRNSLVEVFGLSREFQAYTVDTHVTQGYVRNGQLDSHVYEGYPQEFYKSPALAPMRFSQLWRYFLLQGISTGLSQGLSQVNSRLLTVQNSSQAISRHNGQLDSHVYEGYPQEFYKSPALAPMRFSQLWRYFLRQPLRRLRAAPRLPPADQVRAARPASGPCDPRSAVRARCLSATGAVSHDSFTANG